MKACVQRLRDLGHSKSFVAAPFCLAAFQAIGADNAGAEAGQ